MSELDPERKAELIALAQSDSGGQTSPDDFSVMMAQTHYLMKDDDITDMIKRNKHLRKLMPALSHLLRTTRINDRKILTIMKLRWKRAVRYELFIMSDKPASMAEFDAWVNFGWAAIEDTFQGWRGNLVTIRQRVFKLEGGAKKGGLLNWLKGNR